MKKFIRANSNRDWIHSDTVNELIKGMNAREKRMVGKIANSKDMLSYIGAVADTLETLNVAVTESFDAFISEGIENIGLYDWD